MINVDARDVHQTRLHATTRPHQRASTGQRTERHPPTGFPNAYVVKLYVDTTGKQVTVSRDPEPKNDQNGSQRSERGTGRLMWSTQVFVLDETGGEVINVTLAGNAMPKVNVGSVVMPVELEAMPWATNGRNGVAYRAKTLNPQAAGKSS